MTTWIEEEEAKLRQEEAIAYARDRVIIEEITPAKASLRDRLAQVFGRTRDSYEEAAVETPGVIIEPGDLMGSRYVVWHPGKDY